MNNNMFLSLVALAGALVLVGAGCNSQVNLKMDADDTTSDDVTVQDDVMTPDDASSTVMMEDEKNKDEKKESDDAMEQDDDTVKETDDDSMKKDDDKKDDAMVDVKTEVKIDVKKDDTAMMQEAVVFNLTGENFSFSQKELRVKKGQTVTVNFESNGGFHDWVVDEFDARTKQVNPGEKTSTTFVASKAGTFEYYCSVGKHRANGMVGKLIVE